MGKNPIDRGKQGTKRSLLSEGGGVPIGLCVAGANRNDFKLLLKETIESIAIERAMPTAEREQGMCLRDKGYDYDERSDRSWWSLASRRTSAPGAKKRRPSNAKPATRHGVG